MTYPAISTLETNRIRSTHLSAGLRRWGIRRSRDGRRSDEGDEGGNKDEGLHDNGIRYLESLKED